MSNVSSNNSSSKLASASDSNETLIYGSLYAISSTGICGSLLILSLSFSPKLKGDYKYFIFNVALVDLITECTWLFYLLSVRIFTANYLPKFLLYVLSISLFSSYLTALTAPLPAALSRFVLFRKNTGIVQYRRYFTKMHMFIYFAICDIYPFVLTAVSALTTSYNLAVAFETIFMFSFIICYILVGYVSQILYRVMRRYAVEQERLHFTDYYEKKQTAKAFLYLGIVPLCCQFFHFIYACLFICTLYWGAYMTGPFWRNFTIYLTFVYMYGIAINPVVDIIIVFLVMKPYKTALLSLIRAMYWPFKHNNESSESIELAMLQADRYLMHRRSTLRGRVAVGHD